MRADSEECKESLGKEDMKRCRDVSEFFADRNV